MAKKAAKKAAKTKAAPRAAKTDRKPRERKQGFRPIGEALEQLADDIQANARDAFKPDVVRGDNVDVVNGRWKTTNGSDVRTIAKRYQSAKDTAASSSSAAGEILKRAEENKSLDIWAFREAYKFSKLPDELLCRRLPVFLKYLDDLGVSERSTAQADLLDAANQQPANPDDEGGDAQTDVETAIDDETRRDEAAAAATGLAPSRRPTMTIVPRPDDSETPGGTAAAG